jgi:hypothetical protein
MSRIQDISDMPANSVSIGLNSAFRGRSTVRPPSESAPLGRGSLGLKFESVVNNEEGYYYEEGAWYKKTFQSYILNENDSGHLYLMVIGSETDNVSDLTYFNHTSDSDSVDLFELPGRPLLINRTK